MLGVFIDKGRIKDRQISTKIKMGVVVISETKRKGSGIENIEDIFDCRNGVEKREKGKVWGRNAD